MTNGVAVTLVIEASTSAGSVALMHDRAVYGAQRVVLGTGAADVLYPAIVSLCDDARMAPTQIGRVVCGEGPGSFTSLRIAAALAKGMAFGMEAPLAAVSSLVLAAATVYESIAPGRYAVHADALRQERFVQWIDISADGVAPVDVARRMSLSELLAMSTVETRLAVRSAPDEVPGRAIVQPEADALRWVRPEAVREVAVASWEPAYGRLAEAQVQWEARHGTPLPSSATASP